MSKAAAAAAAATDVDADADPDNNENNILPIHHMMIDSSSSSSSGGSGSGSTGVCCDLSLSSLTLVLLLLLTLTSNLTMNGWMISSVQLIRISLFWKRIEEGGDLLCVIRVVYLVCVLLLSSCFLFFLFVDLLFDRLLLPGRLVGRSVDRSYMFSV